MPAFQSLIGLRFGRWTVLSRAKDYRPGIPAWLCRCDCGKEGVVRAGNLKAGESRSCGCLNRDIHAAVCIARNRTHGLSKTPTYRTWQAVVDRCCTKSSSTYAKYGAKGVTICDRWRNDFTAFLADMGERPKGLTIDRIDNAKGYEPGNCRWATMRTQQNNRTNNSRIVHNGMDLTVTQWAHALGLDRHTIYRRLKMGMSAADALSTVRHGRSWKPLQS